MSPIASWSWKAAASCIPIPGIRSTRRPSPATSRCEGEFRGRTRRFELHLTNSTICAEGAEMPKTIVKIDLSESPYKNELIHNRWHPDVPIIEWVKPGEDFVMETYNRKST